MIKQTFFIEGYWKVIVLYNIDYNLFYNIDILLAEAGATSDLIDEIYYNMSRNKAKAVTYSNLSEHISVVLFNHHKSPKDYLNSIVHEAEHIKQAMLKVYRVEDKGEPPAYTIGYIVMRMYEVFKYFICS